jgi:hypothetical protein
MSFIEVPPQVTGYLHADLVKLNAVLKELFPRLGKPGGDLVLTPFEEAVLNSIRECTERVSDALWVTESAVWIHVPETLATLICIPVQDEKAPYICQVEVKDRQSTWVSGTSAFAMRVEAQGCPEGLETPNGRYLVDIRHMRQRMTWRFPKSPFMLAALAGMETEARCSRIPAVPEERFSDAAGDLQQGRKWMDTEGVFQQIRQRSGSGDVFLDARFLPLVGEIACALPVKGRSSRRWKAHSGGVGHPALLSWDVGDKRFDGIHTVEIFLTTLLDPNISIPPDPQNHTGDSNSPSRNEDPYRE